MGGKGKETGPADERQTPHRGTLDLLPVPAALLERDDGPSWVNTEFVRVFGRGRGEAGGADWPEGPLSDPPERSRILAAAREEAKNGEAADRDATTFEATCEDGNIRSIRLRMIPLQDDAWLALLEVVFPDITELKRGQGERRDLETQVRHAQKMESLGVLAGGVAHDFNNLLMGMLGNADLALLKIPPDSPARDNLASIRDSSQRAAGLCRQLLAYSGKGKFVVEPLDLCRVVRELNHLLEISTSKRAVVEYALPPSVPPVSGDLAQIQQVVMNLVANAAEAMGDGKGLIRICAGSMHCDREFLLSTLAEEDLPEGAYSWIEVTDGGPGMDEEMLEKIFDPFFSTKFPGRGLGLSAVAGILRGHKGAIHVKSEPGKGTTFRILLPATAAADAAAGDNEKKPVPPRGRKRGKPKLTGTVLVVDDEEAVLNVARRMLEQIGMTVIAASDGASAVELFRERATEIDLVLLDLTMSGMDGEETFRALQALQREVTVILASGYSEQEVARRFGEGTGPAGFLQKPFTVAALREKLVEVLGR